ncbi:unnamed protein product, partial [Coregonus sp. 'balchen']
MAMLLRAEECWVERLKDPSVPPPPTDERYDGGAHDHTIPVKNLTPLSMSLSKRDSLLEKCAMFREVGVGLSRQLSLDSGLNGPTAPSKLEQAKRAYHMMLQERRPQFFILSGESGSGKTEACKHIVRHLAVRSSPKGFSLEPRMKHVNCILEAFGHAKTPMNDNSSRFIKLLSLQYCDKRKTLLRARIYTYMLEKSRVAYLPRVPAGDSPPVASASTQSRNCLIAIKQALRALGFNKLEVDSVFMLLSVVLQVGDLSFISLTDAETAYPSNLQLLERVSGMLQVCSDDLSSALTSDVQYFKGDVITRRHTVEMSQHFRDQLAKALDPALEIGILDIFGFEEFQRNGFEQYVSEVLFQQEQAECLQEAVAMETLRSPGNQPAIIDFFFQKPQGLLSVMDEETSESVLVQQLFQSKLTQTGSLVPSQARMALRGPKAALLLNRMSSPTTLTPAGCEPRRYLDLTKVLDNGWCSSSPVIRDKRRRGERGSKNNKMIVQQNDITYSHSHNYLRKMDQGVMM